MSHPNIPLGHKGRVFFLSGKYCFTVDLVTPCVLHNINNPLVDIHILKGENKKFSHLKHESWCEKERMMSIGIL